MLRWHQTVENEDLLTYYKGLIRLRKKLPGLCDKSAAAAERISKQKIWSAGVVSFEVDNRVDASGKQEGSCEENWERLMILYNASDKPVRVPLPAGNWEILADGVEADCRKPISCTEKGMFVAAARSGMILGK